MKKTMDMKAIHYVWIICILALVGCDKEENKIGIPETIEVMADLSFIDRTTYNDPKPASLYFSLISDKGEFQHCTFSFRGKEWTFTVPVGMINLGHTYHEDDSLVTCHAVYALNNDIQAKKPKVKMLECDLSWKVSYLYENALPKQMRHEINEKKQLVISWDKLLLSDESLFSKYSLRCEGKVYEIDDINQTSIAFDDYYGQFFYIDIGAEIKDNIGVWPWDPYRIEKQEPFFTFEDTGEKRILRWDNLLNRGVNIYSNDSPTIHNYTGNELEVPYGKYGEYEKRIYFQFHTTQEQEYYDDNVIR
ncbi:hypothetical protein LJC35_06710, partial [Parabacteroides sp. OttesenSCG-928-N08]|nr:hypothetical protein [Parabacteroides sp. OttesenSCG-928-N08]